MTAKLDLLDALDIAAAHLLEKAGVGATMDDGTAAKEAPLTEPVKNYVHHKKRNHGSMESSDNSTVRRLNVEEVSPKRRPMEVIPTSVPPQTSAPLPASTLDVVVTAFSALGYALSARALLLLSLVGAFVLSLMAITSQTTSALEVLIAYCCFTVIPVAYLEIRRRQQ